MFKNNRVIDIKRHYRIFRLTALLLVLIALGACAPYDFPFTESTQTAHLPVSAPATRDRSKEFKSIFCDLIAESSRDTGEYVNCNDYFYRSLGYQARMTAPEIVPAKISNFHVVIIPGILGECIIDEVAPFQDSILALKQKYPFLEFVTLNEVGGRSSSRRNASIISEYFETAVISKDKKILVIGYSKGTTDFLHYLASDTGNNSDIVDAFVSVAGAVSGTPIADINNSAGSRFVRYFPMDNCEVHDGGGLDDLTTRKQMPWLAENLERISEDINFYSVATASEPDNTSYIFAAFTKQLKYSGGSNDGQVPATHQILPGSDVLGTLNADHWAIILPFENRKNSELGWLNRFANKLADKNHFPREVLLESLLITISRDLN